MDESAIQDSERIKAYACSFEIYTRNITAHINDILTDALHVHAYECSNLPGPNFGEATPESLGGLSPENPPRTYTFRSIESGFS